jgi:hypothetical protein
MQCLKTRCLIPSNAALREITKTTSWRILELERRGPSRASLAPADLVEQSVYVYQIRLDQISALEVSDN